MMDIPFNKVFFDGKESDRVLEVMNSGWLTRGPKCVELEKAFAEYVGAKYAIAVNSCTSALFLCLKYYLEHKGIACKMIGVPSWTFTASASVINHCHKRIKFLEVSGENYCLLKKQKGLEKCDAVVAVHLTGNACPVKFSKKMKFIIEDSAHRILPNTQGNNPVCYSFYATKNMTTGEGGMITTNDEEMAIWLRKAMLHGINKDGYARYATKNSYEYSVEFCGWKMNMTDLQAAIGLEQLRKLDVINKQRQRVVNLYNQYFGYKNTGLHLYPIFVKDRTKFFEIMREKGIHCSCHFLALHKMPAYKKYNNVKLPMTEYLSEHEVSLPLFPGLSNMEVDYIANCVLETKQLMM